MTKKEYLESENVKSFIEWFCKRLNAPAEEEALFNHCYHHVRDNKDFTFNSLSSALNQYCWRGKSFKETEEELKIISNQLKDFVESEEKFNDAECFCVCEKILKWGGISRYGTISEWEQNNVLCKNLKRIKEIINSNFDLDNDYYFEIKGYVNAGFSQILSLFVDEFIIYDSRVGSALCAFVRDFCIEKGKSIPKELNFSWVIMRGENPNKRCPNTSSHKFTRLRDKDNYLLNNIKANWLLSEVVKRDTGEFGKLEQAKKGGGLRALEAALFMVGYNIWTPAIKEK
ncbi:MAG: hypothetical protein LBS21_04325 [Clostridiales bacterium]|jgi:hypothetical protein|nr:hypothetical protein [Clostridiales bacterium]